MPDEWEPHYEAWQADPTPDRLNTVVTALAPTIHQQLARAGMHQDPLLKAKARTLAADAVQTWTPGAGASLPTWVGHQMTQLHRFRRLNSQVLQIPEGIQLDALRLEHARRSFVDDKKMKPLILFADKRDPNFPDVPTSVELGHKVTLPQFRAIVIKSGTDPKIVKTLSDALAAATRDPEYVAYLKDQYADANSFVSNSDTAAFLAGELKAMKALIADSGVSQETAAPEKK